MSTGTIIAGWSNLVGAVPERQRAVQVCIGCHARKIRCNVAARKRNGQQTCSPCERSKIKCVLRRSKRQKRIVNNETSNDRLEQSNEAVQASVREIAPLDSCLPLPGLQSSNIEALQDIQAQIERSKRAKRGLSTDPAVPLPREHTPLTVSPTDLAQGAEPVLTTTTTAIPQSHNGDLDTGFLQVFEPENSNSARMQSIMHNTASVHSHLALPIDILCVFVDTYFEYCHTWCPVFDKQTVFSELASSPLLSNALAVAASHIKSPLVPSETPATFYSRACQIFYNDGEPDALLTLKALLLFYWWAPRSSSAVHRHSSWFWTSIVIRTGQQMNMHRRPAAKQPQPSSGDISICRRVWWTAYVSLGDPESWLALTLQARERLTALCQSKPTMISVKDCTLGNLTLADFPSGHDCQRKGEIFIHWVSLCGILGRIAKYLSREANDAIKPAAYPAHLGRELVDWITELPSHLKLPISMRYTPEFDRDIHQLHLPYLAAVIVLHLEKTSGPVPLALPPAILAASCIARIYHNMLARRDTRSLTATNSWYCGLSFITLVHASRYRQLRAHASADLDVITLVTDKLRTMWGSSAVVYEGFDRLRNLASQTRGSDEQLQWETLWPSGQRCATDSAPNRIAWMSYFPFVSSDTSEIARLLLEAEDEGHKDGGPGDYLWYPDTATLTLQEWFDAFEADPYTGADEFAL